MEWTGAVLLGLGAYLLGSIPTAYILVYLVKGTDIRRVGTGNVGALNTFQQVGSLGRATGVGCRCRKGRLGIAGPPMGREPRNGPFSSLHRWWWPGTTGRCF